MRIIFVLALSCTLCAAIRGPRLPPLRRSTMSTIPMRSYAQDCFKPTRKHVSFVGEESRPGAGMTPDEYAPYAKVLKDGFFEVDCAKDLLFYQGDKHGDGKFSYALGDVSNVSIVHYSDMTPKEDREEMSHEVCFRFCRTIPDMLFFGIFNGRDCYCTPYFKPVAGDSSQCDAVCPAKPTEFCGGKHKSSLFEMHECKDSLNNLAAAIPAVNDAKDALETAADLVTSLGEMMQENGEFWQAVTGSFGQPAPSDLMQAAKVFAGELVHAAEDGTALKLKMDQVALDGQKLLDTTQENPASFDKVSELEEVTHSANELATEAETKTESLQDLAQLASPKFADSANASKQYYPLTYFVDKKIEAKYSACGGKQVKKPMINVTVDTCARACDANVHDCVGFSYFYVDKAVPICFLFSKFTTVTYVIDCPAAAFLQSKTSAAASDIQCFGKLSEFPSSIAPDASGKCEGCLKEANKFCAK